MQAALSPQKSPSAGGSLKRALLSRDAFGGNEEKRVVIKPDSFYGRTDFRGEPMGRRYRAARFIDGGDRYFGAVTFDDLGLAKEYARAYLDKDSCFYTREDFFEENADQ